MTREDQFELFWRSYPRRVAKGAARKAFDKAIKKTTLENMTRAIREYIARKPEKIDFKHPATWLNSECWDDEWALPRCASPTPLTPYQQRHQDAINAFTRETSKTYDQFAGDIIDLEQRDFRAH